MHPHKTTTTTSRERKHERRTPKHGLPRVRRGKLGDRFVYHFTDPREIASLTACVPDMPKPTPLPAAIEIPRGSEFIFVPQDSKPALIIITKIGTHKVSVLIVDGKAIVVSLLVRSKTAFKGTVLSGYIVVGRQRSTFTATGMPLLDGVPITDTHCSTITIMMHMFILAHITPRDTDIVSVAAANMTHIDNTTAALDIFEHRGTTLIFPTESSSPDQIFFI